MSEPVEVDEDRSRRCSNDDDDPDGARRMGRRAVVLLFPLLWGAVLLTAFLLWRGRSDRRWTGSAEEILAERYARGEITAEELQHRRDELRRKRR
jgi:hypothetical protein